MEPFKWEKIEDYKINLGESAELFSRSFESEDFWHRLQDSHIGLKQKYTSADQLSSELLDEIAELQTTIETKYKKVFSTTSRGRPLKMGYGLKDLENK